MLKKAKKVILIFLRNHVRFLNWPAKILLYLIQTNFQQKSFKKNTMSNFAFSITFNQSGCKHSMIF